ncbi:hypothetical protein F5Y12DRAFT_762548 [Xylaria sp. FL1777]|nr:hypothetical protein F5Y12DRAFT_762548 [Xylaria sp. FL1777]
MKYASLKILFANISTGFASDIWSLGITLLELRLDDYDYDLGLPSAIIRNMERYLGPIPPKFHPRTAKLLELEGWNAPDGKEGDSSRSDETQALTGPFDVPINDQEERECRIKYFSDPLEIRLATKQSCYSEDPDTEDSNGKNREPVYVKYDLAHDEVRQFADLLRKFLRYNSAERMSSQVLEHPLVTRASQIWLGGNSPTYIHQGPDVIISLDRQPLSCLSLD